ncbi:DUF6236 family protein [Mesorhizobium sp. CCNWLW179-1]|uniref:DUF6236 family protein n=2 Tax=Mesorhizobium TaxID=68287 RepID=UPI003014E366
MNQERGLVVSPPIQISGNSAMIESTDLDPQELRMYLLFWDKLDFPEQNYIQFGLAADAEYLIDANVLQRTKVTPPSGWGSDILRNAHVEAFKTLDAREPGKWSLATGDRSISFPEHTLDIGRGALVRIHQAIPVPNRDVALADILEFRTKRRAELLSLRHHLEEVYQRVISAGDGPLAWNTEIERLQNSIGDHIKSAREAKFKFRLADISANLNLLPVGIAALAAHTLSLPMISALLSSIPSALSLSVGSALKGRNAIPTPYKYVSSYHQELFFV